MHRVLRSLRLGPHRVDVVEFADDDGSGCAFVVIDGAIVTDALTRTPGTEEVFGIYARWKSARTAHAPSAARR